MLEINELWKSPFPIDRETRIATFGSCFAQHFSRALVARDFSWLNAEPEPEGMSPETAKMFNYGVFSARTGNIYTVSLLRQWTEWALGKKKAPEAVWEKDGRFYDPFRPAIEPGGFGSSDELLVSRAACIRAFRRALRKCDVLVFTLGLTESWWDAEGGFEYPMCPGTVAGEFDPQEHLFKNQEYPFIRTNLVKTIRMIRADRKRGPRFLLTVSPVPLTATNSGKHVLVATTQSKSILRAVAGSVADQMNGVSYFPSYEIISSFPFKGRFFESNLRSVRREGVDHVMENFFAGLPEAALEAPPRASGVKAVQAPKMSAADEEDLVCEEELLNEFGTDNR